MRPLWSRLLSSALAWLACLPFAAGCASYEFRAQDILLRHDAGADTLEVVVVSYGLIETRAKGSAELAAEAAAGARHVVLFGWPFDFRLERIEKDLSLMARMDALAARALPWVESIEVVEAGAWLDEDGEIVLYQRLILPNASEGFDLLNAAINRAVIQEELNEGVAESLGPKTGALWKAFARDGRTWASMENGALVVRIPMSPEGAARSLEKLLKAVRAVDPLLALAEPLSAVAVEGDLLTATWRPDATGRIRIRVAPQAVEDDSMPAPMPVPASMELLAGPPKDLARLLDPATPAPSEAEDGGGG